MSALSQLVSQLVAVIASFGVPAASAEAPAVTFVPQKVIATQVCGRPCPIFAVFDPDKGILMDDRLDPLNDLNARSILLHELVHFAQWKATKRVSRDCAEWLRRERKAYAIQFAWLVRHRTGKRRFPVRRPKLAPVLCNGRL